MHFFKKKNLLLKFFFSQEFGIPVCDALLLVFVNEIKSLLLLYLRNCRRAPKKRIFSMQFVFVTFFRKTLETNFGWEHMRIIFYLTRFYLRLIINDYFYHLIPLKYWTVQSVVPGLTGVVFECDIAHRRSVAALCMLYKIRCNSVHPLNCALPGRSGRTSVHLISLDAEPRSTAWLLFPSRCSSGTILLTQYSMVWYWRVLRAGPMLFYWP